MVLTRSQKVRISASNFSDKESDKVANSENQFNQQGVILTNSRNNNPIVDLNLKSKVLIKAHHKQDKMSNMYSNFHEFWKEISDVTTLTALCTALGMLSVTQFDYNGFDAVAIVTAMIARAAAANLAKKDFFQDIVDIVLIGNSRGNIREDQIPKTVQGSGATRIRALATRYNIRIRKSKTDTKSPAGNELTFTRALSVFPHIASLLIFKSPSLARNGMRSELESESLPAAMKHSGFAGLIPSASKGIIKTIFVYAHCAYMIDFGRSINVNNRKLTIKELYETQKEFCQISMDKSLYSNDVRIQYLIALELHKPENFRKIFEVASKLYNAVKGSPMDINGIMPRLLKNNVLVYLEDDKKMGEFMKTAPTILNSLQISDAQPSIADAASVSERGSDALPSYDV